MDLKHCYRSPVRWCMILVSINVAAVSAIADEASDHFFDQQVAPLLVRRCIQCHNGFDLKGKLDLSTREGAFKGGESGSSIHGDRPSDSLLWQRVSEKEMPPEKPLAPEELQILDKWFRQGASWGTNPINIFRFSTDDRAGYDWWASGDYSLDGSFSVLLYISMAETTCAIKMNYDFT